MRPVADTRRMGGSLLRLWARRRARGGVAPATPRPRRSSVPRPDVALVSPYPPLGERHGGARAWPRTPRNLAHALADAGAERDRRRPARGRRARAPPRRRRPRRAAPSRAARARCTAPPRPRAPPARPPCTSSTRLFLYGGPSSVPALGPALRSLRRARQGVGRDDAPRRRPRHASTPASPRCTACAAPWRVARAGLGRVQRTIPRGADAVLVHEPGVRRRRARRRTSSRTASSRPRSRRARRRPRARSASTSASPCCASASSRPTRASRPRCAPPASRATRVQLVDRRRRAPAPGRRRLRRRACARSAPAHASPARCPTPTSRDWFAAADVALFPYPQPFAASGPLALALAHGTPVLLSEALAGVRRRPGDARRAGRPASRSAARLRHARRRPRPRATPCAAAVGGAGRATARGRRSRAATSRSTRRSRDEHRPAGRRLRAAQPGRRGAPRAFVQALPGRAIVATSVDPAATEAAHGVHAVGSRDGRAVARALRGTRRRRLRRRHGLQGAAPVSGRQPLGAAALGAGRRHRHPRAAQAAGARRRRRRRAARAQRPRRWRARSSAAPTCSSCATRSPPRVLADAGAPPPFRVGADAAWTLLDAPGAAERRRATRVIVALSHLAGGAGARAPPGRRRSRPAARAGLRVRLQPWQLPLATATSAARVAAPLGGDAEIVPPPADLADARDVFAGARLVVALRFHALVAAAAAGTPVVAFAHEPKLAGLGAPAGLHRASRRPAPPEAARRGDPRRRRPAAGPAAEAVAAERARAEEGMAAAARPAQRRALGRGGRRRRPRPRTGGVARMSADHHRTTVAPRVAAAPARVRRLRTLAPASSCSSPAASSPPASATSPSRSSPRGCSRPGAFADLAAFLALYLLVHVPAASLSAGSALSPGAGRRAAPPRRCSIGAARRRRRSPSARDPARRRRCDLPPALVLAAGRRRADGRAARARARAALRRSGARAAPPRSLLAEPAVRLAAGVALAAAARPRRRRRRRRRSPAGPRSPSPTRRRAERRRRRRGAPRRRLATVARLPAASPSSRTRTCCVANALLAGRRGRPLRRALDARRRRRLRHHHRAAHAAAARAGRRPARAAAPRWRSPPRSASAAVAVVARRSPSSSSTAVFGDRYAAVAALAVPYVLAMALLGVARVLVAHACATGARAPARSPSLAAPIALHLALLLAIGDDAAGIAARDADRQHRAGRRRRRRRRDPAADRARARPARARRRGRRARAWILAGARRRRPRRAPARQRAASGSTRRRASRQAQMPFGADARAAAQRRRPPAAAPHHPVGHGAAAGHGELAVRAAVDPRRRRARAAALPARPRALRPPRRPGRRRAGHRGAVLRLVRRRGAHVRALHALRDARAARCRCAPSAATGAPRLGAATRWRPPRWSGRSTSALLFVAAQQVALRRRRVAAARARSRTGCAATARPGAADRARSCPSRMHQFDANESAGKGFSAPSQAGASASQNEGLATPSIYSAITNFLWAVTRLPLRRDHGARSARCGRSAMLGALALLGRGRSRATQLLVACALIPMASRSSSSASSSRSCSRSATSAPPCRSRCCSSPARPTGWSRAAPIVAGACVAVLLATMGLGRGRPAAQRLQPARLRLPAARCSEIARRGAPGRRDRLRARLPGHVVGYYGGGPAHARRSRRGLPRPRPRPARLPARAPSRTRPPFRKADGRRRPEAAPRGAPARRASTRPADPSVGVHADEAPYRPIRACARRAGAPPRRGGRAPAAPAPAASSRRCRWRCSTSPGCCSPSASATRCSTRCWSPPSCSTSRRRSASGGRASRERSRARALALRATSRAAGRRLHPRLRRARRRRRADDRRRDADARRRRARARCSTTAPATSMRAHGGAATAPATSAARDRTRRQGGQHQPRAAPHATRRSSSCSTATTCPTQRFLEATLGHFADDARRVRADAAVLRQRGRERRSPRAAWSQQALFFGPIARGKDGHDAMFCCGTNVVFRRAALERRRRLPGRRR